MDITHTGSSMKWRASLLVLQNQVKIKLNALLRSIPLTVTNPSRYNLSYIKDIKAAHPAQTYQCIDILLFVQ